MHYPHTPWQTLVLPVVLACLCWPALSRATTPENSANGHVVSPESIEGVIIVDAEGLIDRVTHLHDLVLIDSRIRADRSEGYIEGSLSLPDIETSCATLAKLVPKRRTPVLFYCNGIRCGRSARAAVIARDCDYRTIYWFRNGMEEWQEKQYPLVQ